MKILIIKKSLTVQKICTIIRLDERKGVITIEKINKKLRAERLKRNLTYEDMADLLGYKSRSTYMYIERGFTEPRLEVMNKIATIFNKPVSYFFNLKA